MENTQNNSPAPEAAPNISPVSSSEKNGGFEAPSYKPERAGAAPQETAGGGESASQSHTIPLPTVAPLATVPVGAQPQQTDQSGTQSHSGVGPTIADDVDLIEKEWVQKAKNIVEDTRDDPHMQEKEVSKLQADYLKKRYGKEVKIIKD
ncbi:hypothetical protein DYH10_01835 [Candidatus Saccharibacteria bacterium CPR2]|nr:hypothetical protein [Candidatus Saccharibacteria bacterium CPR2]